MSIDEIREKYLEEKGREERIEQGKVEAAKALLDILDDETISNKMGLPLEKVKVLRDE